jgi:CrcB protein
MTYLWVGLGSALGGMARYWMTIATIRVTGPEFPWGTIAINVLGSFVIAFFGTLTGIDGRFNLPAEARIFVMVGLCGGYTTFSAFSLQTLDLARDGRWALAAANIVLSVVFCLGAAVIGHYLALLLNALPQNE